MQPTACVYWWNGGQQMGKWHQACWGTREIIRRMGYVAHNGNVNIGPPEGPPTPEELEEVWGGIKRKEQS